MHLTLGYTTSDNRVIDKNYTVVSNLDTIQLYGENSVINPTFIIHNSISNFNNFNYCYCSEFNRYYYIKNITIKDRNVLLECEIDVLKTYATYIKNLNVTVTRQENIGINEIEDSDLPLKNNKLVKCAVGTDTAFNIYSSNSDKCFMLTVNNGYQLEDN